MKLSKFIKNQDGASAVEYALLIALIAAVILGAVSALGLLLPAMYSISW